MIIELDDEEFIWLVKVIKFYRKITKKVLLDKTLSSKSCKLAIKYVSKSDAMLVKILGKAKA